MTAGRYKPNLLQTSLEQPIREVKVKAVNMMDLLVLAAEKLATLPRAPTRPARCHYRCRPPAAGVYSSAL